MPGQKLHKNITVKQQDVTVGKILKCDDFFKIPTNSSSVLGLSDTDLSKIMHDFCHLHVR